ncbi:MAG: membrane protein insertase YidC [Burkholderiales bacterium]
MDTQRLVLLFVFCFSVFFLLDGWQKDRQPPPAVKGPAGPTTAAPASTANPGDIPAPTSPLAGTDKPAAAAAPATDPAPVRGQLLRVETNLMLAEIDTAGGELVTVELRKHRDTLDQRKAFRLLRREGDEVYVAQSGLIGNDLPNHRTLWTLESPPGSREPVLVYRTPGGVEVRKRFIFRDDSFQIETDFEIKNGSGAPVATDAYFQFVRDGKAPPGLSDMVPTFFGFAWFTDTDKFNKVSFGDIDKYKQSFTKKANDGWVALLQHYFLAAWLPASGVAREFFIRKLENGLYSAGVIVSGGSVAPGATGTVRMLLYAGPQEQDKLADLAPGLDLSVDYGWLTIIATPLFWLLSWIYKWVGNWGLAIIVLTIIVKAVFYPLSAASYRSMAKMRVLTPKMQKLKDQYGGDRQRLNQAMMELYKTEKINPLGGCLPIMVQIPVFIALYWVLLASVELRHAPFYGWITDLSQPDPYYVLPVLMGATMIIQTWLSPTPPDPVQAKVMKIMPVAFSVFFFFFPAGLVLYWLVNNILSISQQYYITRQMEQGKVA